MYLYLATCNLLPYFFLGQKFAMIEMRVVLSLLLLKYHFLPDEQAEPIIVDSSLILRSKNKLPVKIKKRIWGNKILWKNSIYLFITGYPIA